MATFRGLLSTVRFMDYSDERHSEKSNVVKINWDMDTKLVVENKEHTVRVIFAIDKLSIQFINLCKEVRFSIGGWSCAPMVAIYKLQSTEEGLPVLKESEPESWHEIGSEVPDDICVAFWDAF